MNAHEAIRGALNTSKFIMTSYVSDLSDDDLLVRMFPKANHIAWQLGHLIVSEYGIMQKIKPGFSPELPAEFLSKHTKETSVNNDKSQFEAKARYLELYNAQRAATIQILDSFTAEELNNPGPENLKRIAPTVGSAIMFLALHELAHGGQFVPLRRMLDKPVLI